MDVICFKRKTCPLKKPINREWGNEMINGIENNNQEVINETFE